MIINVLDAAFIAALIRWVEPSLGMVAIPVWPNAYGAAIFVALYAGGIAAQRMAAGSRGRIAQVP